MSLQSSGKIDKYTLSTLGFLGLSYLGFFVYRGLEISVDFSKAVTADNIEMNSKVIAWEETHKEELFVCKTIFRHISYCLQNLALLFNIFSFIRRINRLFIVCFSSIVLISLVCLIVQLTNVLNDNFKFFIYPLQGFVIQSGLIGGYIYIFKK